MKDSNLPCDHSQECVHELRNLIMKILYLWATPVVVGKGMVQLFLTIGKVLTLQNVHYISEIRNNLDSIKKLDDYGFKVVFN